VDVARLQVVWEHADRLWLAGDVMCRLLKYAQSFAIMSSVNMLVVLSVDRHQAIRRPLRPPPAVRTHQSINQSVTKCHQQLPRYFTWSARRAAAAAINRYLLRVRARPQQQTRRMTQLLSIDGRDRRTDGHLTV